MKDYEIGDQPIQIPLGLFLEIRDELFELRKLKEEKEQQEEPPSKEKAGLVTEKPEPLIGDIANGLIEQEQRERYNGKSIFPGFNVKVGPTVGALVSFEIHTYLRLLCVSNNKYYLVPSYQTVDTASGASLEEVRFKRMKGIAKFYASNICYSKKKIGRPDVNGCFEDPNQEPEDKRLFNRGYFDIDTVDVLI